MGVKCIPLSCYLNTVIRIKSEKNKENQNVLDRTCLQGSRKIILIDGMFYASSTEIDNLNKEDKRSPPKNPPVVTFFISLSGSLLLYTKNKMTTISSKCNKN